MDHGKAHRKHLFGIAYRMLGSAEDAEDIVQEAMLWFHKQNAVQARDERALLTTVVVRRSLDLLRSAKRRRTDYVGEWLPEPVASEDDDPAVAFERAETLSAAFLLMLERLGPVERAVFVLRQVFDYDYAEIARLIDRTPENCRQIMSRARASVRSESLPRSPESRPNAQRHGELLALFLAACREGSIRNLATVLSLEAQVHSDGGGLVSAALNPVYGREACARFLIGIIRKFPPDAVFERSLNGSPGVLCYSRGRLVTVLTFAVDEQAVTRVYSVRSPLKLRRLERVYRGLGLIARVVGFFYRLWRPIPKVVDPLSTLRERQARVQERRSGASAAGTS